MVCLAWLFGLLSLCFVDLIDFGWGFACVTYLVVDLVFCGWAGATWILRFVRLLLACRFWIFDLSTFVGVCHG